MLKRLVGYNIYKTIPRYNQETGEFVIRYIAYLKEDFKWNLKSQTITYI